MSGLTRPGKHKNALLHRPHSCWFLARPVCVLSLEVNLFLSLRPLIHFLLISLPGAIGMFTLSIGVARIQQQLPDPVYALLSGLNASTVGIIALAAVQLSEGAIKDRLARILVIFGALMGLCYTALWYFPIIMVAGGLASVIWDEFLSKPVVNIRNKFKKRKSDSEALVEGGTAVSTVDMSTAAEPVATRTVTNRDGGSNQNSSVGEEEHPSSRDDISPAEQDEQNQEAKSIEKSESHSSSHSVNHAIPHAIPLKIGILIIIVFFCKLSKFLYQLVN
jgi:hypothetical protein